MTIAPSLLAHVLLLLPNSVKQHLPAHLYTFYYVHRHYPDDPLHTLSFLFKGHPFNLNFSQRWYLLRKMYTTSLWIDCPHAQKHILAVLKAIFTGPPGCFVEAGSFKGGSTAKFSLAAHMTRRQLIAFDSFEGIPANEEVHDHDIFGRYVGGFQAGSYQGRLAEVKQNVARFGELSVCRFVPGWFEETLPHFNQPISVAYIDVDLASSTRTCLKYLYPLLVPGGVLFSQDGHLPLVIEVFEDDQFWEQEIGCPKPPMEGVGSSIMIKVTKPHSVRDI